MHTPASKNSVQWQEDWLSYSSQLPRTPAHALIPKMNTQKPLHNMPQ